MALKESEIRVLVILGLIILILWAFFGLFWSLLLVFTFLIYAYNFGRQQNASSSRPGATVEDEPDVTLYQEQLPNDPPEFQDLPFTCLQKGQFTLRSPMPLLSDVTKRLSFNTSTVTPHFQAKMTWNDRRQLSSPYLSRGNSVAYWRKSNHFSLLNPALQKPSTVKIASPDVTLNRTFTLSNSPLKRTTPDHANPCSRDSVLSALRESRKRSFAVDDEEDPELILRPTKRRGTKPVNSVNAFSTHDVVQPINRPIFSGLKRAAIHDRKETVEENVEKKSKSMERSVLSGYGEGQRREDSTQVAQKRKNVETKSSHHHNSTEAIEGRKSKKTKNSTAVDEQEDQKYSTVEKPTTVERNYSCMAVDSSVHDVIVDELNQDIDSGMNDSELKQRTTKNSSSSKVEDVNSALTESQQTNTKVKSGDQDSKDHTIQSPMNKDTSAFGERKRFTIPRFLSKEDSRRRTVPVYCASNEESELPQRRTVTRTINQEQMKIDRKLAWERVKKFLDDDDDDEEEAEEGKPAKSVSYATTSTGSSSLFKIPTGLPVKIPGTAATTTTQSLVVPALSTGNLQQTTGGQGNMANSVPQTNGTVQSSTALTQSQVSMGPLSQSQQTVSGLFTSSVQGMSTSVSTPTTAIAKQVNLVNTTCASGVANFSNPSTTGFQVNSTLTSTVASSETTGFQVGNLPFSKPIQTDQLNSLTDPTHKTLQSGFQLGAQFGQSPLGSIMAATQNSAQKLGFSSPLVTSSSVIGTSNTTATSLPGGFNFATPGLTQQGFSLNKVVLQSKPAAGQDNNPSTLSLETSTSQTSQNSHSTVAFGVNTTTVTQSLFTSLAKPTQSMLSTVSSTGILGQNTNTSQSSFGLMTQNKGGFGSTNMQSISRSTQPVQGASEGNSSSTFGASLGKNSTPNPFNQSSLGSQSNQKASAATFGSNTTQNVFGAPQSQPASQNIFGVKNALNTDSVKSPFTFGSQVAQSTDKNASGNKPSPFTFGSQPNQNAPQTVFGSQPTSNAFGTQLNQSSTQGPFRTHATQNAFGAQLNQSTTQSAFGAPTCTNQASKSSFSFAVNTAQNSLSSPFGGFGNKPATPSQNTVAPSGGFNFTAPASNPTTGGLNFNTAANKTGGFQFGSGNTNSFGNLGSMTPQTASHLAVPSTPSTGFNFAPGSSGMAGSPFASSSPAPAFGAPSTPQGPNTMLTARPRARVAARRRGKK